jgi:hypothetical protein
LHSPRPLLYRWVARVISAARSRGSTEQDVIIFFLARRLARIPLPSNQARAIKRAADAATCLRELRVSNGPVGINAQIGRRARVPTIPTKAIF